MYVMICSRPDLAYIISLVNRYTGKPGKLHWEALKWIFKYLKSTTDVIGFVDSDYFGCLDT